MATVYSSITFKEFSSWCNERAADGKWSMNTAIACSTMCTEMYKVWWFKREKVWKEKYEKDALSIFNEINRKIELEKEGKLKEELEKKRAHTRECYKKASSSPYNTVHFRKLGDTEFYTSIPYTIKPEAAYTGNIYSNRTKLYGEYSKNLGDYMSQPYTSFSLYESLIYNEHLLQYVYSVDIYPEGLDICDSLLVLTADDICDFDAKGIDNFIVGFLKESALEVDKEAVRKDIENRKKAIENLQNTINILEQYTK
jgi:hypothetical protein